MYERITDYFEGNEPFDMVLGVLDKTTGKIIKSNDDGEPNSADYSSAEAQDIANNSTFRTDYNSFLTFDAVEGHEYAV